MKKRAVLGLVGLLLTAGAIYGCGGDDGTTALSKQEFIKQGNAVCKAGESERTELFAEAQKEIKPGDTFDQKDKAELVRTVLVEPYEKMIKGVEELGAPEGDEQQVEALLQAMEKATQKAEADPARTIKTIIPFAEANKAADEYGLTDCVV